MNKPVDSTQTQQQAVVTQLSQQVVSGIEIDTLLNQVVHQIAQILPVDYTAIFELLRENDTLVLQMGTGWPPDKIGHIHVAAQPETLIARPLFNQEPYYLANLPHENWSQEQNAPLYEQRIISGLMVPIQAYRHPFGILGIYTNSHTIFTEADSYFLQSLANIITMALKQTSLTTEVIQRNRQLYTLQSAGTAITSQAKLDDVLKVITEEITDLLGVTGCAISKWEPEEDTLILLYDYSIVWSNTESPGKVYHLENYPLTKKVLVERVARQIHVSAPEINPAEKALLQAEGIETLLMLPMIYQNRVIGLLELMDDWSKRIFTPQEIALAQLQANQGANAIEAGRLYSELQQRLTEQTALRQAMESISSTLEPAIILRHLAEQMCQAMQGTSAYICTYDATNHTSTVVAEYISRQASELEQVSDLGEVYEDGEKNLLEHIQINRFLILHIDDPNLPKVEKEHMIQYGANTILYILFQTKGKVLGYSEVWESRYRRDFTPSEITLCDGISQQAAMILENASLYQQAQQEIRERKQAQAQLQAYQEHLEEEVARRTAELVTARDSAEAANRAKSTFLANMSHELRTPLAAIIGYSELLTEQVDSLEPNQLLDHLHKVDVSAHHLLSIINDVLDMSKIEAGKMSLQCTHFGVAELIDNVLINSQPLFDKNNNFFQLIKGADLDSMYSDPTKVKQVLLNLLSNAAKFTVNGEITLRAFRQPVPDLNTEEMVFQVIDTGPGIPPEKELMIFQPFMQVDDSTTRQYGGTGLGLAISYRYSKMMGGTLTFESRWGHGTTFTLRLPTQAPTT